MRNKFLCFLFIVFISVLCLLIFQQALKNKILNNSEAAEIIKKKTVLVFGDSIVRWNNFPSNPNCIVNRDYNGNIGSLLGSKYVMLDPEPHFGITAREVQLGIISGSWINETKKNKKINLINKIPDILVIRLGNNDVLFTDQFYTSEGAVTTFSSFQFIIEYYKKLNKNISIIIDKVPYMDFSFIKQNSIPRKINREISELTKRRNSLNLYIESLQSNSKNIFVTNIDGRINSDSLIQGFHPNACGVKILSENVVKTINSIDSQ